MRSRLFIRLSAWTAALALVQGLPLFSIPSTYAQEVKADQAIRESWNAWNKPFKPFRIIGNVYYVGVAGVSSFLITTTNGHILLDTGFQMTVPLITNSLHELGFQLRDVKFILSSHAHVDHTGGHSLMKSLTGATISISQADADLLASGGANDFTPYATDMIYAPAKADRLLQDGDTVKLGQSTLTCHLTPGHTKGCTTWTMDVADNGRNYHVVFFGSTSVLPGVNLINNPKYKNIADDYTDSFKKLKALPCDVFLAPHASFFNLAEKAERLNRGEKQNPFIDGKGYREFIAKSEQAFQRSLKQEREARQ